MTNETHQTTELVPGVTVDEVIRVTSVQEVARILDTANAADRPVIPFGGRRSLATGNPASASVGLDLTGLAGILAYEPADLTLSVRAGTTMAEIQASLGESGQELPIDVPDPAVTTIGGLVATGFAGPRRLRSGSLRDLLIGCEFVRGDGLVARAGGMVVKNVSGFEIPRFLHGSWGGLAVLTSVNLKVMPLARADGTSIASFNRIDEAISAAHRLVATQPAIEACVVTSDGEGIRVAARATGRAGAVAAMQGSFAEALGTATDTLDLDESRAWWQSLVDRYAERRDGVVVAMGTRPRDIGELASQIHGILDQGRCTMQVSPGTGSIRVVIPGDGVDRAAPVRRIVNLATGQRAPYILESAPEAMRSQIPTWGPEPEGIAVMRAVKQQFDPANILNRGRLAIQAT